MASDAAFTSRPLWKPSAAHQRPANASIDLAVFVIDLHAITACDDGRSRLLGRLQIGVRVKVARDVTSTEGIGSMGHGCGLVEEHINGPGPKGERNWLITAVVIIETLDIVLAEIVA